MKTEAKKSKWTILLRILSAIWVISVVVPIYLFYMITTIMFEIANNFTYKHLSEFVLPPEVSESLIKFGIDSHYLPFIRIFYLVVHPVIKNIVHSFLAIKAIKFFEA